MTDSKWISTFFILVGLLGLWLESTCKLQPILKELVNPQIQTGNTGPTYGQFFIALLAIIFLLSFLDSGSSLWLSVIIVMGALLYDYKQNGDNDLIHQITQSL